jgi:DNA-binding transcriptional LysR family regulator
MNQFNVSPDDCLLLKTVHETSSLREAASVLNCDPAGLTRRIQKLAEDTGYIQKVGLRWKINSRGLDLIAWVNDALASQERLLNSKQSLRIGTNAWFAEEVLIPQLKKIKNHIDKNSRVDILVPEKSLELSLIDGSLDFVIVCHPPENPEIEHRSLMPEELVIVAPISWQDDLAKKSNPLEYLRSKPIVRHLHMNFDLFLPELKETSESDFGFDTLASVKTAVRNGLGWSLVPKFLVEYEKQKKTLFFVDHPIDIKDRKVCLWWLRNRSHHKKLSLKLTSWLKEIV